MKRPNGSGSVVKLSGRRRRPYVVKVSGRNAQGRIVQVPLSYHPTAAEAYAALDQYNAGRAAMPSVDRISMTVGDVFAAWSAHAYRKLNLPSIQSHNAAWNRRVSRYADRKMRSMTLADWQAILDEDDENGLSQSLISNDAILIRALNQWAMQNDVIVKDYSAYLDVPTVDIKNPRNALTDLQVGKLTQLAAAGEPWADTALMLCYTGFRVSELLALTRFAYHADGDYLQGGGKTKAGQDRIIPVHPKIKPYLMTWLARGGDTIICDDDGHSIAPYRYRTYFKVIAGKIGAPQVTPHWCRHTFSTRLYTAGVEMLTIKWLMGHSTRQDITAHYTHSKIDLLQAAVLRLA